MALHPELFALFVHSMPLAQDLVPSTVKVGLPTSVSPRPLGGGGFDEKMPPMGSCAQVVALFGAEPSGGGA